MSEKIALFLQDHFIEYCAEELGEQYKDCSLTYLRYETLPELQDLFLQNKNRYDVFVTSGAIPLNALREVDTPSYAVKGYFGGYLENTYRILLEQILKRGGINPSRIGLDYLEDSSVLEEVLEKDRLPELVGEFEKRMLGLGEAELEVIENHMVARYLGQCREGKLDFVVTYFYSVVKALQKEGICCSYAYPSKNSLIQTLDILTKSARLDKIRRNLPAVIRISPDLSGWKDRKNSNQELELLAIKGALLEYCRAYKVDPVLKDDFTDIEIYMNAAQMRQMTGELTCFDLPIFLEEKAGFKGSVSIGSSEELGKARIKAMQAKDYSLSLKQPVCVYIDEKEQMFALPYRKQDRQQENCVSAEYVEQVANEVHLSSETIYRVIAALQMDNFDEVTASDLVRLQKFSLRIATRVLAALSEGGYAEKIGQKRIGNKGRPQNLYKITLKYG